MNFGSYNLWGMSHRPSYPVQSLLCIRPRATTCSIGWMRPPRRICAMTERALLKLSENDRVWPLTSQERLWVTKLELELVSGNSRAADPWRTKPQPAPRNLLNLLSLSLCSACCNTRRRTSQADSNSLLAVLRRVVLEGFLVRVHIQRRMAMEKQVIALDSLHECSRKAHSVWALMRVRRRPPIVKTQRMTGRDRRQFDHFACLAVQRRR